MRRARAPVPHVVVGLDLSINSAGVVILHADWEPGRWDRMDFGTFCAPKVDEPDVVRFKMLASDIVGYVDDLVPALCVSGSGPVVEVPLAVFIEGYAFNMARFNPVQFTRLVELGSLVKMFCLDWLDEVPRVVTEGEWKKLLLGFAKRKGTDPKALVQSELRRRGAPFETGDECDAFGCASWGRSELGLSAMTFAEAHLSLA